MTKKLTKLRYGAAILAAAGVLVSTTVACGGDDSGSRQDAVATKGASVMPFDQDRTVHHFVTNSGGGVETVVVKDARDSAQVGLVREHLKMEAERFARGDFSDPAAIHGDDMPGLGALRAGASRLSVRYGDLPDGGQIEYSSTDAVLVASIHDWFHAQTSDHGKHAMSQ